MSGFLQRVENAVDQRRLLLRGQKILVAVSGGADSMALLHSLHSLASTNRWKIFVAHFNHRLRGSASDADEELVRRTAAMLRLRFFVGDAEVEKIAAQSKLSVEMAARKLRHEFLARTAQAQKIPAIALAHHADDQVELFFLRLLRGAGGEGLAGMKWLSPSPADKKITLVRPLLGCSKVEILAFAREHKIRFREDASNRSTDFRRNRIRNKLLPLLRKDYQPGLEKAVLRLMDIVGAETEFVGDSARAWLQNSCSSRGNEAQTKIRNPKFEIRNEAEPHHEGCNEFEELPSAVQRRVLQLQLTELGIGSDFELIEQLRGAAGKWVSVTSSLSVARGAAGKIQLREASESVETGFKPDEFKLKLSGRAGRAEFGGRKFRWQIQPQKKFQLPKKRTGRMPVPLEQTEFFDADKIGGEIVLRHWRPGERFQPIGLKAAVKLQDLFVNAKIPAARRRTLVLATTAAGEIFWVEGLRIGEPFKLVRETRRRLRWNATWVSVGCELAFTR